MAHRITFEFDTAAYVSTHGKAPSGYGSWTFDWEGARREPKPVFAPTSNYVEAKRWMKEYVRAIAPVDYIGHIHITVCT